METQLYIDIPLDSFEDDILGCHDFAEYVRRIIDSIGFDESIVIAVTGQWGSGKTTFTNFISSSNTPELHIAKFNPWWFTPTHNITMLFFNKLIDELKSTYHEPEIIRLSKKFFTLLNKGRAYLPAFLKSASVIAGQKYASPTTGSIIGETVGELLSETFEQVNKKTDDDFDNNLDECKKQLIEILLKHEKRILFIIDDIDRLQAHEICELINTVKTISDLPKITFLLVYDRSIVEKAISTEYNCNGEKYLEKIVQLQFEIPHADGFSLQQLFYSKLSKLPIHEKIDPYEWRTSFQHQLIPYIEKIRDINRIINTMTLTYFPVREQVHFFDFLALTFLYIFEKDIYTIIHSYPEKFLCFQNGFNTKPDDDFIDHILSNVEHFKRDRVNSILQVLFPVLTKKYTAEDVKKWRKDLRIASPENFDVYFSYLMPKHLISQMEIKDFLECSSIDYRHAIDFLKRFLEQGNHIANKAFKIFDDLSLYGDDINKNQCENIARSLLIFGDTISRSVGLQQSDIFSFLTLPFAAYNCLSKINDDNLIEKIIIESVDESESINLIMHVNHFLGYLSERTKDSYIFSDLEKCKAINQKISARIEKMKEEEFLDIYHLGNTVQILWSFDDKKAINEKILNILQSEHLLYIFLYRCLQTPDVTSIEPFKVELIQTDLKLFHPSTSEGLRLLESAVRDWKCVSDEYSKMKNKVEWMIETIESSGRS